MVGISAPDKKYLAPADTLMVPPHPPLSWETPPPSWDFQSKTGHPPSCWRLGLPLTPPRAEKIKNIRNVHQEIYCWAQYPWASFVFLGVMLDCAETPFAKTPFSWFLLVGWWVPWQHRMHVTFNGQRGCRLDSVPTCSYWF